MPRKGENIYKRKDGRWEGRYIKARNEEGQAVYGYVYAKTYRDVKEKLLNSKSLVPKKPPVQPDLFRDIAAKWLQILEPQIKASSQAKYNSILKNHLIPKLGNLPVSEISNTKIESICTELLQKSSDREYGLAPKTAADILAVLRAVLKYAVRSGQSLNCDPSAISIKQSTAKIRVFSLEEQNILIRYLQSHPNSYNLGILMSLFTGLRIGEICALRWEDFSVREGVFQVQRTIQRIQIPSDTGAKTSLVVTTPKSVTSVRTIPLPCSMQQVLSEHWESQGYFLTNRNGHAIEPRAMQYHFKKALKECNISDANFHTLRHTFATRCVEVGFDVKSLSEILGHSSVTITMNRYVHPSVELKKQNMQRLTQLFAVK